MLTTRRDNVSCSRIGRHAIVHVMETFIVEDESNLPEWLRGRALEHASAYLEEGSHVVVARRADGDIQVVPDGEPLDADVIADLLRWAAGLSAVPGT